MHGLYYRSVWLLGATLEPGDHSCSLLATYQQQSPEYVTFGRLHTSSAAMIRDGKSQGWLSLPVDTLPVWAALNDVSFDGVSIGPLPGKEDRGSTVIAKRHLKGGHEPPLMTIPRDLILSLERIHQHAKSDSDFRAVLDGLDEFGRVGNSAHLSFQSTIQPILHSTHILSALPSRYVILPHSYRLQYQKIASKMLPPYFVPPLVNTS